MSQSLLKSGRSEYIVTPKIKVKEEISRNPFLNQVGLSTIIKTKLASVSTRSQSLLKSGRSEYLQLMGMVPASLPCRNPFLNQVGLSTFLWDPKAFHYLSRRNPFLNQVGLSTSNCSLLRSHY